MLKSVPLSLDYCYDIAVDLVVASVVFVDVVGIVVVVAAAVGIAVVGTVVAAAADLQNYTRPHTHLLPVVSMLHSSPLPILRG